MPAETYSVGLPVEIGQIDRELKKLWAEGEGAMTRASHINLAVYSEKAGSLARNLRRTRRVRATICRFAPAFFPVALLSAIRWGAL